MLVNIICFIIDHAAKGIVRALKALTRQRTAQGSGIHQRPLETDAHGNQNSLNDPAICQRPAEFSCMEPEYGE